MSTPFMGQIAVFPFAFAPKGWALCNGQLLPINQNQALFSLLGVQFGGNGTTNFALPNLQGRIPLSLGPGYAMGQAGGEATHVLALAETAVHTHPLLGSSANGSASTPAGNFPGAYTGANGPVYSTSAGTTLGPGSMAAGAGQGHPNMPPFLVMSVCIALTGIFPSRN